MCLTVQPSPISFGQPVFLGEKQLKLGPIDVKLARLAPDGDFRRHLAHGRVRPIDRQLADHTARELQQRVDLVLYFGAVMSRQRCTQAMLGAPNIQFIKLIGCAA